jgi:AraC-like DNA-binding protein
VAAGDRLDWAALALELGYFDQAHFARDFKAQLGKTPREYAALTQSAHG